MGHPTKVQQIQRQRGTDQWYINFPTPIAEATDFIKSEVVEWHIVDKGNLILSRQAVPPHPVDPKKNEKAHLHNELQDLLSATERTTSAPPGAIFA